jgi:flagellar assembly protein FliH
MSDASSTAAWAPPRNTGPVISFRGRGPGAAEVEREARAASEAGFQKGRAEGLAAAAREIDSRLQQLDQSIAALQEILYAMARPLDRLDQVASAELAMLAVRVGSELAKRELEAHPDHLVNVIHECVSALPASSRVIRVHLDPRDARIIRERMGPMASDSGWTLIDDPTVGRAGCKVNIDSSHMDATLENRVGVALRAILGDSPVTASGDLSAQLTAEGGSYT